MKFSILVLIAALAIPSAVSAADPPWLAAFAANDAGGAIVLGAMQTPPCAGDSYNAMTSRPKNKEKPTLRGCWKFTDTDVEIDWETGVVHHYQLREFHWSDWVTDNDAPPTSAPKSKIKHKSSDIIT